MYEPVDAPAVAALQRPAHVRAAAARRDRPRASTSRSSACPGTRARRSAPARASGRRRVRSASALLRPYNPAQDVHGLRRALVRRLRRRAHRARLHRGHARAHRRPTPRCIHRGGRDPARHRRRPLGDARRAARRGGRARPARARAPRRPPRRLGLATSAARYNHGTVFKRACEEGLLDPARCVQAGMRGSLYGPDDYAGLARARHDDPALARAARARAGGLRRARARARRRRARRSSPSTSTSSTRRSARARARPRSGGPSSAEALDYVRALRGLDFRAFDVVEVAPAYDGPGQVTALLAANVIYEMLSLVAPARWTQPRVAVRAASALTRPVKARGRNVDPPVVRRLLSTRGRRVPRATLLGVRCSGRSRYWVPLAVVGRHDRACPRDRRSACS